MSVPRPESEILADLARLEKRVAELEKQAEVFDTTRATLMQDLARAQTCASDTALRWQPPQWAKSPVLTQHGPSRCAEELVKALASLDEIEREGSDPQRAIHVALPEVSPHVDWTTVRHRQDLDELTAERERLKDELKRRRRGPGKPRKYRITRGTVGLTPVDGVHRILKPPAVVELDDWEAAEGLRVGQIEPVEPGAQGVDAG